MVVLAGDQGVHCWKLQNFLATYVWRPRGTFTMKQVFVFGVFVALGLSLAAASQIRADTGTVFVQGTASGRLGDNPFMDVQIVFTGTYDTGDITETVRDPSRWWTAPIYATI